MVECVRYIRLLVMFLFLEGYQTQGQNVTMATDAFAGEEATRQTEWSVGFVSTENMSTFWDVTTQLSRNWTFLYNSTDVVSTLSPAINVPKNSKLMTLVVSVLMLGALEDAVLMLIIFKTRTIELNTSVFLGSQCFADFVCETMPLIYRFQTFSGDSRLLFFIYSLFASLSLHMLTLSTFNIYIAICKWQLHRKIASSWKYVITTSVILLVWEVISYSLCYYVDKSFYVDEGLFLFLPTYTIKNFWVGILVQLNAFLIPAAITVWCQFKLYQFRKTLSAITKRKLRLSILICIATALNLLSFIPQHVARSGRFQQIGYPLAYLVYFFFNVIKLPYYLLVYRPFRKTVKAAVCCGKLNRYPIHPDMQSSIT